MFGKPNFLANMASWIFCGLMEIWRRERANTQTLLAFFFYKFLVVSGSFSTYKQNSLLHFFFLVITTKTGEREGGANY